MTPLYIRKRLAAAQAMAAASSNGCARFAHFDMAGRYALLLDASLSTRAKEEAAHVSTI